MATKYPELTDEEKQRNELGKEALLLCDKNPLYDDLAIEFYSKKAKGNGPKELKLSMRKARLAGTASKNDDFLPHMDLRGPQEDITLDPVVDDDCTLNVHYDMPVKTHVHKSMLFPGVILPAAVLDKSDVAILKAKARNSGRDFGGAPLYDNSRRDHMEQAQYGQKRINYAVDRPPLPPGGRNGAYPPPPPPDPRMVDPNNPFAAFLDPKFAPGMPDPRGPPPPFPPPPRVPQHAHSYGNDRGGYGRQDHYQQPQYPPQQGGRQHQYPPNRGGHQNDGRQYNQGGYHQGGGQGQGQNGYGRR